MTSTASDTPKSDLLDTVITAYGDLDRWRSLDRLTAKVSAGGVLWGLKGQPGILDHYTLTLTPNLQSATLAPFAAPDLRATYTPERVAIETVETWAAMESLVDAGLSLAIGLSDIDVEGTRQIVFCSEAGLASPFMRERDRAHNDSRVVWGRLRAARR